MKLTVQLESRVRDMEASMCCIVFLPNESGIWKKSKHSEDVQQHGGKQATFRTRKAAYLVLQSDGAGHRANLEGQVDGVVSASSGTVDA